MTAHRHLMSGSRRLNQAIRRLSSGMRMESAADNPAGIAIRENMRAQQGGLKQALRNSNDAVGMLNVAESGLQSISDLQIRMRELAVQAANDSISDTERGYLDTEFQDLKGEITRVANVTEYNGIQLLDGTGGDSFVSGTTGPAVAGYGAGSQFSSFTFQIGARNTGSDQLRVDIAAGVFTGMAPENLLDQGAAQSAIDVMDSALDLNNRGRARIGSKIRAFNAASDYLSSAILNVGQSISQIADTDMAEESSAFSREQVLQQAGVAMLSQANQQPNLVLRLLG
jgi:flagellin